MLSKINRLSQKKDFDRIWRMGRAVYGSTIGLRILPNNLTTSRFGFVVSTKISKKATERNLVKRRLREIVRKDILPIVGQNVDIVIITRIGVLDKKTKELAIELKNLFLKAGLSVKIT